MGDTPLTDQQRTEILEWARGFQTEHGFTTAAFAKQIGTSAAVLSQVLRDKYAGDSDRILRDLAKLRLVPVAKPKALAERVVQTQFCLDVWSIVSEVVAMATGEEPEPRMGLITAPSGAGKSIALQGCALRYPEALYVEITEGSCSTAGLLRELAFLLKCPHAWPQAAVSFAYIVHKLKGSYRLVIFDEVHHADIHGLNAIRQIQDKTGCPIILAGQPILQTIIDRTRHDRSHGGTVFTRIGPRLAADDITATRATTGPDGKAIHVRDRDLLHTPEDVAKLLKRLRIRVHPRAMPMLLFLANHADGGMLRTLVFLVRRCARANPQIEVLTEDLLKESLDRAMTIAEFEYLKNEMQTTELAARIAECQGQVA